MIALIAMLFTLWCCYHFLVSARQLLSAGKEEEVSCEERPEPDPGESLNTLEDLLRLGVISQAEYDRRLEELASRVDIDFDELLPPLRT